jgi:two-component system, chemotaxis family, CheB/CheR fusion protein
MQDITERKRAEEAGRQMEERFRTLADSVPQIIWTNEGEGKAVYFNKRWFDYSGLTYEQSAGLGWQAIVHHDDAPASVERWQQALSKGAIFDSEYRLRRADGTYRWHIGRNVPMRDNNGQIISWFGSATDIEDLKSAETSLRESRERLRVTMESATDFAIITIGEDGLVQGWNRGAEYIFGYTQEEICFKPGDIIFTPEDREAGIPQKEMQQAREEGRAGDERWHLRKDGSRFYMSGVMTPIHSQIIKGYVKIARDMTGQKRAEEALRISEERYRIALTAAEMGAWDWNITGDKVLCSEQLCLLLGLSLEQAEFSIGFFLQYVYDNDRERIQFALAKAVNETGVFQAEFRIVRADNSQLRWMSGYARTVAHEDGQAARIVGVMYDVTTRKMLEQQKDEFIGIASHELKTPVTSIKAYVEVLNELFEEGNVADQLQLIKKLDVQVDRLTDLIRTLLDTTKMSEGQLTLNLEEFNVSFLLKERVEEVQATARNHRFIIHSVDVALVTADRDRIGQALVNMLSNAVKYSPNGGEVIVTCELMPDGVRVGVRDLGIGMSQESSEKVFDRFFRVRTQQTQALQGMGLGLYITAGIIRRHGGTIWAESKPGEGSVFYFKLPYTVKQVKE